MILRAIRQYSFAVVSAAIAVAALSSCNSSTRSDKKQVAAAENEVYEAVVRDMTSSHNEPSQLVFGDSLLTHLTPGAGTKSCEESARENVQLQNSSPMYNSPADKAYQFASGLYGFVSGRPDSSIREDTIQNFLKEICTPGRLSQSFHTDLPKTFVNAETALDSIVYVGPKSFRHLFPGAAGVISFSHVGFDSTLHQAIVAASFECGVLCAWEDLYVLQKARGRWEVVKKRMIWES